MTKTDLNTTELARKILAGEALTEDERQQAALLLRFEGMGESALLTAREYGAGSVILSGYAEGADSEAGDPPLFAVTLLHEPDAQTWAAVQAALDDEAIGPDELLARLRALPQEWRDKASRAGGGFGNGLHDAANMLEAALSGERN